MHGFAGAPSQWDALKQAIPSAFATASALALPGHETLSPVAPGGYWEQIAVLAAQLAHLGPCRLVGYSLGGRLALGLARRYPQFVVSLHLIGTHPGLVSEAERMVRKQSDAHWASLLSGAAASPRQNLADFTALWEAQPVFSGQSSRATPAALAQLHTARMTHDPQALADMLMATSLAVMPNFWPELRQLHAPTQWIVGALDSKFVGLAEDAAACCSKARLVQIPHCGHNVPLEAPDALAAALTT